MLFVILFNVFWISGIKFIFKCIRLFILIFSSWALNLVLTRLFYLTPVLLELKSWFVDQMLTSLVSLLLVWTQNQDTGEIVIIHFFFSRYFNHSFNNLLWDVFNLKLLKSTIYFKYLSFSWWKFKRSIYQKFMFKLSKWTTCHTFPNVSRCLFTCLWYKQCNLCKWM